MRRFSFAVLALALIFIFGIDRNDDADLKPAAAEPELPLQANGAANPADASVPAPVSVPAVRAAAKPQGVVETAAVLPAEPALPPAAELSPPAGGALYEQSKPVHLQASAKAGGIDPELDALSADDLVSAAQQELKRLGCYDASIDGKWGRKSRAAVDAFNERAGGDWDANAEPELIASLKNYPAGFCTTECEARSAGGECVAAAPAQNAPKGEAGPDQSYLPPWMQGAKVSSIEPPAAASAAEEKVLSDEVIVREKPKRAKRSTERRRDWRRERRAERYEPRYKRRRDWAPEGWPGTR